ncbi:MAG: SIMPL domain-containing protein [Candidatus Delongbacteria bacterium]|nr:SIMPL domain-containing protein [Candidatus Delongbacteria bacterium]
MLKNNGLSALILGISIFLGLSMLGFLLSSAAVKFRMMERSVTVKGLAEREIPADIVIWPIQFITAENKLEELYNAIDRNNSSIKKFLTEKGIDPAEVTFSSPSITDKSAQQWGGNVKAEFRYSAEQTVTVYSKNIDAVRKVSGELSDLGKQGIVLTGADYQAQTEYIFTGLNEIKPAMIEEATRNAREVALKFAKDSQSGLGKIKSANQGQFSIESRDRNNPHIKKVRVVSTVEYYLSD